MTDASPSAENPRRTAALLLARWMRTGDFPERLIPPGAAGRAFVVELVHGAVKWRRLLDWVVARFAPRRPPPACVPYLWTGLYQILLLDRVADYAAVNETVAACKRGPAPFAAGFVNALLRRAAREHDALRRDIAAQGLGVRESHPDDLLARWVARFGEPGAEALCRWNNGRPDVVVRVDRRRVSAAGFAARLRAAGVEASPHPFAPEQCLTVPRGIAVSDLPGYDEGLFGVQDPATLRAVELLDPRPGEAVLDACAAPGGKTAAIAERMDGRGRLVALERHGDRLARLEENCRRLRLRCVETVRGDAASAPDLAALAPPGGFDRILLDVPCTNTGVLRRRPDARWRFSEARLDSLARTQQSLLDSAAGFLKPGGTLVYSSCSLEPEEGMDRVRLWLAEHPAYESGGEMATFPPEAGVDGIYAAALRLKPNVEH